MSQRVAATNTVGFGKGTISRRIVNRIESSLQPGEKILYCGRPAGFARMFALWLSSTTGYLALLSANPRTTNPVAMSLFAYLLLWFTVSSSYAIVWLWRWRKKVYVLTNEQLLEYRLILNPFKAVSYLDSVDPQKRVALRYGMRAEKIVDLNWYRSMTDRFLGSISLYFDSVDSGCTFANARALHDMHLFDLAAETVKNRSCVA